MQKILIPKPQSGGLILSYRCSGECKHCMYFCSPKWGNFWINEKDLELILEKISGFIAPSPYGSENVSLNHGLHITGGEPFLNYNLLLNSIQIANELQIPSLFVETNCYWCKNDDLTRNKLTELRNHGLKGILISVNPFILEFVPFERTERAIRISNDIFGNNIMVYQMYYYQQFKSLGIEKKLPIEQYLKQVNVNDLQRNVELFKMGRAIYKLQHLYKKYPLHYFFDENCSSELVRPWHNHFDNYGNYIPGYCGGLSWGKINNLESLCSEGIDLEEFPVFKSLILGNLKELHSFGIENFNYQGSSNGYISKCHLCFDIRRKLALKTDKIKELQPQEFYNQI
ncbi:MAG: radical SAM protein [Candidatus Hodarchaeota archaeon]